MSVCPVAARVIIFEIERRMSTGKVLTLVFPYVLGKKNENIHLKDIYFDHYTQVKITVQIERDNDGQIEFDRLSEEIKKKHQQLSSILKAKEPFKWDWIHFEFGRVLKTKFTAAIKEMYGTNNKLQDTHWAIKVTGPYGGNIDLGLEHVITCTGCCDLCRMLRLRHNLAYLGDKIIEALNEQKELKENNNNNNNKNKNKNKKRSKKDRTEEQKK
eukprot:354047_1